MRAGAAARVPALGEDDALAVGGRGRAARGASAGGLSELADIRARRFARMTVRADGAGAPLEESLDCCHAATDVLRRSEVAAANSSRRATAARFEEECLPVRDAWASVRAEIGGNHAEGMVEDRGVHDGRVQLVHGGSELKFGVDRIDPQRVDVRSREARLLKSHERHVVDVGKVSRDEPSQVG